MLLSHRVIKQAARDLEDLPIRPRIWFTQEEVPPPGTAAVHGEEAEAILTTARIQADRLMAEAHSKIVAMEQEARQRGFRQGQEEAQEEALRLQEDFYRSSREVLQQIKEIRDKIYRDTEQELVELAIDIAEKIVCRQLDLAPETILDLARNACSQAKECELVVVYTAPEQAQLLKERQSEIAAQLYRARRLEIIADPSIGPGGCRIETEQGYIDATLETMMQQLNKLMKERA